MAQARGIRWLDPAAHQHKSGIPQNIRCGCQQPVISLEGFLQKFERLGPQAGLKRLPVLC